MLPFGEARSHTTLKHTRARKSSNPQERPPHVFNRGRFAISRVFLQAYSRGCFLYTQLHHAVMYTVYKRNIDPVDSQNTILSSAKRLFQPRFISDLRGSRSCSRVARLSELECRIHVSCFDVLVLDRDSRLRNWGFEPI